MADTYPLRNPVQQNDPAIGSVPVDYSGGDVDLSGNVRGIHCNVEGDIKADFANGTTDTLTLLAGVYYPYQITKVYQTDSDATISVLY